MKKVININFQGRVVPIEESAYDMLKQYVESLRRFFANEEGRDEIINDIESRIAELFTDNLKKGSTCITDDDVNVIIESMGRPEDFEAEEANVKSQLGGEQYSNAGYQSAQAETSGTTPRGRLYRDETDKILGGVCGGLANYLRIDSSIVRILFAIITFGGFGMGFLLYILLWIVLPSKSLDKNLIKKRLFRNPEERIIAGVAGGLAAYFNISVWLPRLIFALPLILGIISGVFSNLFHGFDEGPSIIFGSFGSTLFIIYVVLWAVIPEANTASEKLEMKGEKVDLNTIKNTIQEDLSGFKARAEKWGKDAGERAKQFGTEVGEVVGQKGGEAGTAVRKGSSRLVHAIGVLFKAFFLFIAGVLAFALLMATVGMLVGGVSVFPLKDYILDGFGQNLLALGTIVLFLGVPIIGLITWIVRRVMKIRSKSPYMGWLFGGLWTIGWICAIFLAVGIFRNFNRPASESKQLAITQPAGDKMIVKLGAMKGKYYSFGNWDDDWRDDGIMLSKNEDSMLLNNVSVQIAKSDDSAYHIHMIRFARGKSAMVAEETLQKISFELTQKDSVLELQKGFAISKNDKFRNQRVAIIIEVPVGKKVQLERSLNWFDWFEVHFNDHRYRSPYDKTLYWNWSYGREYKMTDGGLERIGKDKEEVYRDEEETVAPETKSREELEQDIKQKERELEESKKKLKTVDSTYRYTPAKDDARDQEPQAKLYNGNDTILKSDILMNKFSL